MMCPGEPGLEMGEEVSGCFFGFLVWDVRGESFEALF
jgi:hypothetical protein